MLVVLKNPDENDSMRKSEGGVPGLMSVRPVVRGVRVGGRSVVITAIVVRPMVVLRISNASGIVRAHGCAERGAGL